MSISRAQVHMRILIQYNIKLKRSHYYYGSHNLFLIFLSSLCRSTNGYQKFPDNKRFVYYMIYALGIPALTMVITSIIDSSDWIPEKFKSRIGTSSCSVTSTFDPFDSFRLEPPIKKRNEKKKKFN